MTPDHELSTHQRRLACDPANPETLQRLGVLVSQQGDGIRAITLFVRAAHLHGNHDLRNGQIADNLHLALNQTLARLEKGSVDEVGGLLDWLGALMPSRDLLRIRGMVHLIQGHDAEAQRLRAVLAGSESGFATAVDAVTRHKSDYDFLGTVVIPVYRMEDTIGRALDSVAAAVRYYRNAARKPEAQVHICVVDDCSPDGTVAATLNWAAAHPEQSLALIANNRNRGAGRARNAGAAAAMGSYLWFLDADDLYLEPHLFLTAKALDQQPEAAFVRTGILFDQIDHEISPTWRQASEVSYPCNLCVRRSCHALTGGFPEEAPFHPAVADDVAYARALHSLFPGIMLVEKTVHYTMRPGNVLSRLHKEMTGPGKPGDGAQPDARFQAIEILTRRRLYALNRKRTQLARDGGWDGPPFLSADGQRVVLARAPADASPLAGSGAAAEAHTCLAQARELLRAGDRHAALLSLRKGAALDPADVEVWFEMGVVAYTLGFPSHALRAFHMAAVTRPDLVVPQFNVGSVLLETGCVAEAALQLRRAVALQPDHVNALVQSGRAARRLGRSDAAHRLLARALRLEAARPDLNAEFSQLALEQGDGVRAIRYGRCAVLSSPDLYSGHAAAAAALEILGREDEALLSWQRAIRCNPGFGEAFTRHTLLQLSRIWGPPPVRPATTASGRRLACTTLGTNGRFGNQLLQYGVLRLYADVHGLELEVPPWIGRYLYDRDDALPGPSLPRIKEEEADLVGSLCGKSAAVHADRDIEGYFCGDTTPLAPYRDQFRHYFQPGRHLRAHAESIAASLRRAGETIVALHLRRGDYGWGQFWTAPEAWYLRWLEEVWSGLDRPALFIATDDPACVRPFAAYRPLTGRDLAEPIAGIEFFADFHALCQADLVAISNSTFSFAATLLNQNARHCWRPDRSVQRLIPYEPWSAPVLI